MQQPNRPDMPDQEALVERRFELSMTVPDTFFENESGRIAEVCWAMAHRFSHGGRLLTFGNGAQATDAQHVSVEFVHPVIVGKRALPALALTNDSATMSGMMAKGDTDKLFVHQMRVLARPQDIAMGFSLHGNDANVLDALHLAREMGLLSLCLTGGDSGLSKKTEIDYIFAIPSHDPFVIQETHETLYHVLWELVHIFFEHEGLL
jgi:D-sedoheptulose 7-phosphate isomerase